MVLCYENMAFPKVIRAEFLTCLVILLQAKSTSLRLSARGALDTHPLRPIFFGAEEQ
jgi:hypothetical protein